MEALTDRKTFRDHATLHHFRLQLLEAMQEAFLRYLMPRSKRNFAYPLNSGTWANQQRDPRFV